MAGEIQAFASTGLTLYAQIINPLNGQIYNTVAAAFQSYLTANIANYAISLTEQGTASGLYIGNLPTLAKGRYPYRVFKRIGGSPAESDKPVYLGEVEWDGSAATFRLVSSLANDTITDDSIAVPAEAAGIPTRILAMMRRVWEVAAGGVANTRDRTTGIVTTKNAAGNGNLQTMTQSTAGTLDTISKAT